jgi:hypothetical protein
MIMKKTVRIFAILVAVAMGVFTSCIEDEPVVVDPPTIEISSPQADTITLVVGNSVQFVVTMTSENGLAGLKVLSSAEGVEIMNGDVTFEGTASETVTVTATIATTVAADTQIELSFVVEDSKKSATTKKVLVTEAAFTQLAAAQAFEWKRVGGANATGLEMFGLLWNSNTADNAVIKKDATKFVELDAQLWGTLTTVEGLKEAVDAATDMDRWEKVSATMAQKTYDFLLGTIKGDKYYLIHVTNSTVSVATAGTTITISGEYKE